jgi:hypothetical protein
MKNILRSEARAFKMAARGITPPTHRKSFRHIRHVFIRLQQEDAAKKKAA